MRALLPILFASILILAGCGSDSSTHGVITYDVLYMDEERERMPVIDLLPETMTQTFNGDCSRSMIEGFMGMFMASYVTNCRTNENSILFKVMGDKKYCSAKIGEPMLGFDEMPNITITETGETSVIAGLPAKKARVDFADKTMESFDIYYTETIKIKNANWHTPYKAFDKVLLDFKVKFKGISMHIKAKDFVSKEIGEEEFAVPEGFSKVTTKDLDRTMQSLMDSANIQ